MFVSVVQLALSKVKENFLLIAFLISALFFLRITMDTMFKKNILFMDFKAYMTGVSILHEGDVRKLYDLDSQTFHQEKIEKESSDYIDLPQGILAYLNPPLLAAALLPLSSLNYYEAYTVFLLYNLVVIYITFKLLADVFSFNKSLAVILIFFPAVTASILSGQISPTIFLIFLFAYKLVNKSPLISGLLSGLILLKPQLFIFTPLLVLLAEKRKVYFYGLFISSSLFYLLNVLFFGSDLISTYSNFLVARENPITGTDIMENFNIHSIYGLITKDLSLNFYLALLGIAVYFGSLLLLAKKASDRLTFLSLGIVYGLALNVHTMASDLIFLLIPLSIILSYLEKNRAVLTTAMFLVIYLLPFLGVLKIQWVTAVVMIISPLIYFFLSSRKVLSH
jgi:hypothetical protein